MLLSLLFAASASAPADTIPDPRVELLGDLLGAPRTSIAAPARTPVPPTARITEDALTAGSIRLLGELLDAPTYLFEEAPIPEVVSVGRLSFASFAALPLPTSGAPGMPVHDVLPASEVGFTPGELDRAIRSIDAEVRRGSFPGAALAVGRWDRPVVERGFGTMDRLLGSPAVDPDHTIYDLASLTKVIATTTAVMVLVEDGRMQLDAPVSRYLPGFSGGDKDRVTIRHLLTHSSGLPAGTSISAPTPYQSLERAIATRLVAKPGQKVEYSDIGFIVLWAAAEAAHGGPLDLLLQERIFEPLGMYVTSFRPGDTCIRCAPTDDRPGYRGIVHDPLARQLGGIAGHAGLFSTAHDLSLFAAMLVNGGELEGVRVLKSTTIDQFTRRQAGAGTRALGWDTPDVRGAGAGGLQISSSSFGHTGFTGTSLWVDPVRGTWVVLLSNRTYQPNGPNRMQEIRRELNDRVATSVDLGR